MGARCADGVQREIVMWRPWSGVCVRVCECVCVSMRVPACMHVREKPTNKKCAGPGFDLAGGTGMLGFAHAVAGACVGVCDPWACTSLLFAGCTGLCVHTRVWEAN